MDLIITTMAKAAFATLTSWFTIMNVFTLVTIISMKKQIIKSYLKQENFLNNLLSQKY